MSTVAHTFERPFQNDFKQETSYNFKLPEFLSDLGEMLAMLEILGWKF